MAFRATHAEWGMSPRTSRSRLRAGMGGGVEVRPAAPLTCDECGHRMHAKVSRWPAILRPRTGRARLRARAGNDRPSSAEVELVNAARDAGRPRRDGSPRP